MGVILTSVMVWKLSTRNFASAVNHETKAAIDAKISSFSAISVARNSQLPPHGWLQHPQLNTPRNTNLYNWLVKGEIMICCMYRRWSNALKRFQRKGNSKSCPCNSSRSWRYRPWGLQRTWMIPHQKGFNMSSLTCPR